MNKKNLIWIGLLAFFLLLLWSVASFFPDWLWFENLGFSSIFWTMVLSKFGLGALTWLVLMFIVTPNLLAAKRIKPQHKLEKPFNDKDGTLISLSRPSKVVEAILIGFFLLLSFMIAAGGAIKWDMVLRYLYQQPFDGTDPIFNGDIGFYVYSLPFYIFVQNRLLAFFGLAAAAVTWWYLKDGAHEVIDEFAQKKGNLASLLKISLAPAAKKHLIFLGGIIVLLLAWDFYLKMYGVLYSTQGPAFGASYTDVHVKVPAYKGLIIVSLGLAVVLFLNVFKPRTKLIWIGVGIWAGAILVFANLLPALIQKIVVKPNELAKESAYIDYNIDYTRKAYNLDKIKEVDFEVSDQLSAKDVDRQSATIKNIRIWDERTLLQTYRQLQSIRLYYDFQNVDVDRYVINNQYRQVMLAARELVVDQLPPQANTWVNRHLKYTHGYGLALSPVSEVTPEGLPLLLIKDLPPSFHADLKIDRPEIYYGEKTDEYVLIKTTTQEFDYPKGDKNAYTNYQGKGGVAINSFVKRILFALEFLDSQILFTAYLSPESRIMYNRRIDRRVSSIAPFLDYDRDPYLVVSEGKLYWMLDAYTSSNMYPYSRRSSKRFKNKALNYIRNSVKVTVDAYNGAVSFYIMDEKDPLIRTYAQIFPDLFKPFKAMPADLKQHIRYPRDLFDIQVDIYKTYHMDDVQVFYNQEDLWEIPNELYGGSRQRMEPYYIILKLPEANQAEFLLMLPFTPSQKDNMIGWLAARSDLPNYGNLLVYKLPKEKLVYGPMQIEARVDQQTEISRELSLWGQGGSRVIRGNLLAIPVGDSFIYVEPVYLEARQEEEPLPQTAQQTPSKDSRKLRRKRPQDSSFSDITRAVALPELKRVIVAFGNRIIMEENLDKALNRAFQAVTLSQESALSIKASAPDMNATGKAALEYYLKAKDYLREGNWTAYGKALENMEKILMKIDGTPEQAEQP